MPKKYISMIRTHLSVATEYRSNIIGIFVLEIVGFISIGILWISIFSNESTVGGFSFNDTLYYYLFVPIIGMITSINMAEPIGDEIREGILSNHLLKPQHIWLQYIARWIAAKINTLILGIPIYMLILTIVFRFIPAINLSTFVLLAMPIAILAYFMNLLLDLAFSWLAFWLDTLWWVQHLKLFIFGIFAGASFPLDFFPEGLRSFANILPFKFLYYVPLEYALQRRAFSHIVGDITNLLVWMFAIYIVALILWKKGISKYEAFGN